MNKIVISVKTQYGEANITGIIIKAYPGNISLIFVQDRICIAHELSNELWELSEPIDVLALIETLPSRK